MNTRISLRWLIAAITLTFTLNAGHLAAQTTVNDAIGDIDPTISTANGTLDIVKMEVTDSPADVIFTMTVNGNTSSTDWGKFMIGIATTNAAGTTNGNGWGRPINMVPPAGTGMTHWIGSWLDWGGGAQFYSYDGASWTQGNAPAFQRTAGTNSVLTYSVPKASLGVALGDTLYFDAYSSGGDGGDSAIDALCNTNVAVTTWAGPYTSQAPNIRSYTITNNPPIFVTNNITFQVDMSVQAAFSNFGAPESVRVEYGAGFSNSAALVAGTNNVWTNAISISAFSGSTIPYRFVSESPLTTESSKWAARSFTMPTNSLTLSKVFFNNIEGYRDVFFSVNMDSLITNGAFNPLTDYVEVRGSFTPNNDWAGGNILTSSGSNNVYSGTVQLVGNSNNAAVDYKFWASPVWLGYETGNDRSFALALNTNGSPTPSQPITPTADFSAPQLRQITFGVDMTAMEALGRFSSADPASLVKVVGSFNNWDSETSAYQLADGDTNGTYTGTFFIGGNAGDTLQYKFFSPGLVYYAASDTNNFGFEIISQTNAYLNRTNALGPENVTTEFPTVFFSDQLFGVMDTAAFPLPASSFTTFATVQGTPSTAQSVLVSGVYLSNSVLATAPTGFQVSSDGTNYFPSVSLVPTNGTLGSVPLFARVSSTASPGVQTNLTLSLSSLGSQFTSITIGSDVTASPYGSWAAGYGLDPAETSGPTAGAGAADPDKDGFSNNQEYAFGTNPTLGNPALLTTSVSGGNMIVTWLQRTDAAPGSYKVKTTTSLAVPFAVNATLTADITDGSATPTPPTGYVRKQVSVALTGERNFLALAFD